MRNVGWLMSEDDGLADSYRQQISDSMQGEADSRLSEVLNPEEEERLSRLSLVTLVQSGDGDLVGAILARLGVVRAALSGHGGGIEVDFGEVVQRANGDDAVELQLNLSGACIACGAAPGTLQGIQADLLMDAEVQAIRFSSSLLDTFDELGRDFVLKHGGVTFV
jgi:Fe-S cluster biogenesis protein NfuA